MQDEPYALVPLLAKDGTVRAHAMVSPHRFDWAMQWTWRLGGHGYACRGEWNDGHYRTVYLHRAIAGASPGDRTEVDHHTPGEHGTPNKLDCRDGTLRVLTPGENRQNTPGRARKSRYRGVSEATWIPESRPRKWRARVGGHHLGYFDTEEEAGAVAAEARRKLLPYAAD